MKYTRILYSNRIIKLEATDLSGDTTTSNFNLDVNPVDDLPEFVLGAAGSVTDISVEIKEIPLFSSSSVLSDLDTRYDKISVEMTGGVEGEDDDESGGICSAREGGPASIG